LNNTIWQHACRVVLIEIDDNWNFTHGTNISNYCHTRNIKEGAQTKYHLLIIQYNMPTSIGNRLQNLTCIVFMRSTLELNRIRRIIPWRKIAAAAATVRATKQLVYYQYRY
ncbi:hypothetical protein ACJX0J_031743, partial [Zea mays]